MLYIIIRQILHNICKAKLLKLKLAMTLFLDSNKRTAITYYILLITFNDWILSIARISFFSSINWEINLNKLNYCLKLPRQKLLIVQCIKFSEVISDNVNMIHIYCIPYRILNFTQPLCVSHLNLLMCSPLDNRQKLQIFWTLLNSNIPAPFHTAHKSLLFTS